MDKFSEEEIALARRYAAAIVDRRMAMPATLFLEGVRPLNFIGSQFLHFFNPLLGAVFNYRELEAFALFLEKRESIDLVLREIETLEEARLDREREERRRRRKSRRWWPFRGMKE